ncbi:hypothetical protein JVX93_23635 [Mycolicibacterium boenickei]|nr:hypothetical protein JVX93_23635 [Mycolicibacterium boenickei]
MNPRGRRAALPDNDHRRPEHLSAGGLVVHHCNRHGLVKDYDFANLPVAEPMQRSLAAVFAARCGPHRWTAHGSSRAYWLALVIFTEFVSQQPTQPEDFDHLTVSMIKGWRLHARQHDFGRVAQLLRDDPRLQHGPVADEVTRRANFRRPSRTQSYSEAEFDNITKLAKDHFRSALRRIEANAQHLQRWRDGLYVEGSHEWNLGECLDLLATTGDLPRYVDKKGKRFLLKRHRTALRQLETYTTWYSQLFLTRLEATSLAILLVAEHGWNLSVIDRLEVPLASPDPGLDGHPTYRVPLEKPRRGAGQHFETRNVTDDGATSLGRLITQAIRATRFARDCVESMAPGTNRLIVWRNQFTQPTRLSHNRDRQSRVGPFSLGLDTHCGMEWGKKFDVDESPFRRGRRTVVALDRREPSQHSSATHDRDYALVDKRVQAEAAATIAKGAEDAADHARLVTLVAELRDEHNPENVETATADCTSFNDNPYSGADGGCTASFLMCLGCTNARIHPGHHARLAHLHHALTNLQTVVPANVWEADWGASHARLEELKDRLGQGIWKRALAQVSDEDRSLIEHLLVGNLDK